MPAAGYCKLLCTLVNLSVPFLQKNNNDDNHPMMNNGSFHFLIHTPPPPPPPPLWRHNLVMSELTCQNLEFGV